MRTTAIAFGSWICVALASAGCGAGTQLVPAHAANRAPEQPSAAEANVGGVRLLVEGDAWPGQSATLARGVSAVLVIVENQQRSAGGDPPRRLRAAGRGRRAVPDHRAAARCRPPARSEPIPVPAPVFSEAPAKRSDAGLAAARARTGRVR